MAGHNYYFDFLVRLLPLSTNRIKPTRCGCGEAVAFNVPCLARYIKVTGIDPVITDAKIRHFITSKAIGCVGKSNKFRSRTTSSTSAHISRRYLDAQILGELDKGKIIRCKKLRCSFNRSFNFTLPIRFCANKWA